MDEELSSKGNILISRGITPLNQADNMLRLNKGQRGTRASQSPIAEDAKAQHGDFCQDAVR